MATYPSDATVDTTIFPVVSENSNTTPAATTTYNLPSTATSTAEVLVILDEGVLHPKRISSSEDENC